MLRTLNGPPIDVLGHPLQTSSWWSGAASRRLVTQCSVGREHFALYLGWLVWDLDTGALITSMRPSSNWPSAVVGEAEPVLIAGGIGQPLEGWSIETGELLWRNAEMAFDTSNVSVSAVRALGTSRTLAHVAVGSTVHFLEPDTGRWLKCDAFERTPMGDALPSVPLAVPTWERLPYAITMQVSERLLGMLRGQSIAMDEPSANALRAWLDVPVKASDLPPGFLMPRVLNLSARVRQYLERILHAEGAQSRSGALPLSSATLLAERIPWINDDWLALFAARSTTLRTRWGIDLEAIEAYEPARFWSRAKRLVPLCPRGCSHWDLAAQGPASIARVRGYQVIGGQSLAGWLSEEAWHAERGCRSPASESPTVSFRVEA